MAARARRGARAASTEPAPDPNGPGVLESMIGWAGWGGAASSEQPDTLKPRARPVRAPAAITIYYVTAILTPAGAAAAAAAAYTAAAAAAYTAQTSYNERTLLETERPVYRDWKGDAGQDPMMSDVEYKNRLEEGEPQEPAAAAARPGSTTGYQSWSQEELDLLTQLVQKDGYCDWEAKAKRLGTGRTGQAVRTRYERYTRAQEGGDSQPAQLARASSPSQAPPKRAAEPTLTLPNQGSRGGHKADPEWRQSLVRGDHVDARDGRNNWYESKIVAVKEDQVKIHFLGWSKKWDEWVQRDFDGIQPLGSRQKVVGGQSSGRPLPDAQAPAAETQTAEDTSATEQRPAARKRKGVPGSAPAVVPSASTPGYIKGGILAIGQLVETQEGAQGRIKGGRAGFVIVEVDKGEVLYKRAAELTPVESGQPARAPAPPSQSAGAAGEKPAAVRRAGSTKSRKRKSVEQPAAGSDQRLKPGSQAGTYQSWSQEELDTLVELVEKEGFGDWEAKSLFLGSGRTGQAVRTRYERHMRMLESSASGRGRTSSHDLDGLGGPGAAESEDDDEESEAEEQTLVQRAWSRVTSAFTGSPLVKRQKTKHNVDDLELNEAARRGPTSPRGGIVTGATRPAKRASSSGTSPRGANAGGSANGNGTTDYEGQTREERERFWDKMRLNKCQLACRERNLWPGGDKGNLRDRLVQYEFDPDGLSDFDWQGPDQPSSSSAGSQEAAPSAAAAAAAAAAPSAGQRKTASKDRFKDKRKASKTPALPLSLLMGPGSCTGGATASKASASNDLHELVSSYSGTFLENMGEFLEQYGVEIVLPSIESHLEDVLDEDYPGHNFGRGWRVEVDGGLAPQQKFTLRIYENDTRGGCEHCTCSGWGERPVTTVTYHFMVISEPKHLDKPVLSLHGMLHANGYGHLLHVNGKEVGSFQTGALLMDVWDGLCIALGACQVSLQDKSMKSGLHLRVIHAVAYDHSWYGRWGYKFERGSYGNEQSDYTAALEALQSVSLESVRGDCTADSGLVAVLNRYAIAEETASASAAAAAAPSPVQATQLQTIQDLFRHMLELLRSKRRSINKDQVVYDLTTFTRGILFGEAFHVEDGDGRKTSGTLQQQLELTDRARAQLVHRTHRLTSMVPVSLTIRWPSLFAVKRAKQVRRCAQVLLDCRWFVKRFIEQRIEMLADDQEERIRVISTLAAHLKLQVRR